MDFFAAAAFALESVAAQELKMLNMKNVRIEANRVFFQGDEADAARACVFLRSVDRVFLLAGRFSARSFDELFEGIEAIKWPELLSEKGRFCVTARCVQSKLMSQSDVQRITKKAIVRSMQRRYRLNTFPETEETYKIEVSVYKDEAVVALDLCGEGLHKRGYRTLNAEAPLRETFAAGLLLLANYDGHTAFADPFCGSGTLGIEAAMLASGRAPGAGRSFLAEAWRCWDKKAWQLAREAAADAVRTEKSMIFVSDIDPKMVEMTQFHAKQAGVEHQLIVRCRDARKLHLQNYGGIMVTNPPYGERLMNEKQAQELLKEMRYPFAELMDQGWRIGVLTPYQELEKAVGCSAQEKRRLFNGNISCRFYQFFA